MSVAAKSGKNETLSIGLGLISWIFPNIPTAIKIVITLLVIAIIIFLVMEKGQRQKVMSSTARAFTFHIIPGLAGALLTFFYTLIGFAIISIPALIFFDKPNLFTDIDAFHTDKPLSSKGWIAILADIATHLNTFGYIIAIILSFIGMRQSINEERISRAPIKPQGQL